MSSWDMWYITQMVFGHQTPVSSEQCMKKRGLQLCTLSVFRIKILKHENVYDLVKPKRKIPHT